MLPRFFQAQRFLSIDSTEAIEQQLADIGERDGVAARNAFQSDLPDQGAKKTVDRRCVSEIRAASEEFLGGLADALVLALGMMSAEGFFRGHDKHTAAMAASVDMAAELGFGGFRMRPKRRPLRSLKNWLREPLPPCFLVRKCIRLYCFLSLCHGVFS